MKAKPTKAKKGKVVKKNVVVKATKKRAKKSPFIFIDDASEDFFERLTVLRGILRGERNDKAKVSGNLHLAFTPMGEIERKFGSLLNDLQDLPIREHSKECALFYQAMALEIFQMVPFFEEEFPDFQKHGIFDRICTLFKLEWDKKDKSPDRKAAASREEYQAACNDAIMESILLHEYGLRKHWHRRIEMPQERWGSPEGKKGWQVWIRNLLSDMHKSGELFRFRTESAAKNSRPGSRSQVREGFFESMYILSIENLQRALDSTARLLYLRYTGQPCPEPFNRSIFIDLASRMHPEILIR